LLLTVITALFGNEIKNLVKHVIFNVSNETDLINEETVKNNEGHYYASKYYIDINIINTGAIFAEDCKIRIISIKNKKNNNEMEISLLKSGDETRILWNTKEYAIHISPMEEFGFTAFVFNNLDVNITTPATAEQAIKRYIVIGQMSFELEALKGVTIIEYSLSCRNYKNQRIILEINWDGILEERKAEMLMHLSANVRILRK
jgi:hypothetical protein